MKPNSTTGSQPRVAQPAVQVDDRRHVDLPPVVCGNHHLVLVVQDGVCSDVRDTEFVACSTPARPRNLLADGVPGPGPVVYPSWLTCSAPTIHHGRDSTAVGPLTSILAVTMGRPGLSPGDCVTVIPWSVEAMSRSAVVAGSDRATTGGHGLPLPSSTVARAATA